MFKNIYDLLKIERFKARKTYRIKGLVLSEIIMMIHEQAYHIADLEKELEKRLK